MQVPEYCPGLSTVPNQSESCESCLPSGRKVLSPRPEISMTLSMKAIAGARL